MTGIPVNKVPISPAKTPTKITMIPVTIGKSPQRIAPASIAQVSMLTKSLSDSCATLTPVTVATNSGTRPTMITMSPSKVFKQGTVIQQKTGHIQIQPNQTIAINKSQLIQQPSGLRPITISNVHQVQGSKFQYVRLVTPSSQVNPSVKTAIPMTSIVQAKNIVATTTTSTQPSAPQIKITLPVTGPQLMPKPLVNQTTQSVQRILLPAPSNTTTQQSTITLSAAPAPTTLTQIRPNFQTNQLPPGTTILSGADAPQNVQGFALVPASYVAQIQQQIQTKPQTATPQTPQPTVVRQEFIPIASNDPNISANAMARGVPINGTSIEPTGARPRKPCNCTKSQCLKLYCDCFANGEFCHNCNCNNCANNLEHEEERSRAIKSCLDRNPMAFHPKIGKGKGRDGERDRRHNKGCNCKRSGCLKNYCECYEAKIMCSSTCKCIGCKNFEESPERKTLMHLADAAEVRVQQQTAAKSKLSSQISGIPSRPPVSSATGERLPYTFITTEVAEATCACLLAQAEEADKIKMPPVVQERMVIEEFGRCLLQIIDSANRTKGLLSRASSDKQPD
ncbi:hypothetical protein KUTeg_004124 [Tegillarca granosa]|uniref:CRC domain-containing protein n=1 Tax=Tegillarca granosa TaxID=220873 RepID=A0ABQ9FTK9_TEGGR|nr:hypothetical protein KUTeg_004124 [Tegillarca granosa]